MVRVHTYVELLYTPILNGFALILLLTLAWTYYIIVGLAAMTPRQSVVQG